MKMNFNSRFQSSFPRSRFGRSKNLHVETLEPRVVLSGTPIISEFLASNDRSIEDQDGADSDWIEILNPTSETLSLNKWVLTDDQDDLSKWRFPDVELAPGESVVVFASGKDRDNPNDELHTNFRLSTNGEYLALVQPDATTVVSEFADRFPPQILDVSYGIPTGVRIDTPLPIGSPGKVFIPTDNSVDPTEPDAVTGTWLDPSFDDSGWIDSNGGIGFFPETEIVTLADSVSEFSSVQGQDNWRYGSWSPTADADKVYSPSEFTEMNSGVFFRADTNKYDQNVGNIPSLEISAEGAMPSGAGFIKQWAIRRWESETKGEITIAGTLGNADAAGDGVRGRILINGDEVYLKTVNGEDDNFSISANVDVGDTIDFVIDPGDADDETGDLATFTAAISGPVFNPISDVVVADSEVDWAGSDVQGENGWFYGFYDFTADPDKTYQAENFNQFPTEYWSRSRWDWPGSSPATQIRQTTMQSNGVDDGVVHWAIRRWESDWDGPATINWNFAKSRSGGDGATGRIMINGVEVDSVLIEGADRTGVSRSVEVNLSSGDKVDFLVDPLGVNGDPAAPDGDDDNATLTAQVIRKADVSLDVGTDIGGQIGSATGFYARFPFEVADVSALSSMSLRVKYDDGFAAYLNGQPVAFGNTPEVIAFNSTAESERDPISATDFETIDLTSHLGLLTAGTNVLQIHTMNSSATDDEMLLLTGLSIGVQTVELDQQRYFASPSPNVENGLGAKELGPIFIDVDSTPNVPEQADPIVVTAEVSQTFNPLGNVQLNYQVMYGDVISLDMKDDGVGDDVLANDGIFTGVIPGNIAEPGQMIRWYMTASDDQGLATRHPLFETPNSEEHLGTVVNDPTLESNLPIFQWFIETPRRATNAAGSAGSFFYNGEFYDNVRFGLHGQSSQGFPSSSDRGRRTETAKSYNVDFPRDHRFRLFDDIRRIDDFNLLTNYADQSLLRNTLAWEQIAATGAPSLMAFPVRVQQNGEFFALYDFVEDGDARWLERVGLDPEGTLYKMYTTFTANGNEQKAPRNGDDTALREIVQAVRDRDTAYLFDNVDLASMANFLTGFAVTQDQDCCHKNYYAYQDTHGTGEWFLTHWDEDLSNGRVWGGFNRAYFDDTIYFNRQLFGNSSNNALIQQLNRIDGFEEMAYRRLRTVIDEYVKPIDTPYDELPLETRIDELYELMKVDAALHNEVNPVNWGQSGFRDFKTATDLMKTDYSALRREWIYTTQLAPDDAATVPFFAEDTTVSYFVPKDNSLGDSWKDPNFDDSAWNTSVNGIGYDNSGDDFAPFIKTNILDELDGGTTAYVRVPFNVESLDDVEHLTLRMRYDDGFVAYLNGVEVTRDRVPDGDLSFNSTASRSHSNRLSVEYQNFDITEFKDNLKVGENVLAIHSVNQGNNNNDMLMQPLLVSGLIAEGRGRIPPAQVGNPKIDFGTIEFQPASTNQNEEYIELVNNNTRSVDITGWQLTGDIDHTFKAGTVIPAGWTIYISPDKKSFLQRTEGPTGGMSLYVIGNYDGRLPNTGGTVNLVAADGEQISTASYSGEISKTQETLRITEVNFNPLDPSTAEITANNTLDPDDFEFVEVINTSETETLNLDSVRFTDGILFDFSNGAIKTIAPGERLVVVKDEAAFALRYGNDALQRVAGQFEAGSGLSNSSDRITLVDAGNSIIQNFRIGTDTDDGWYSRTDGDGSSLEVVDLAGDLNDPANWRASSRIHGTPGTAPEFAADGIVISEVLTNPADDAVDSVEIHNSTNADVQLTNFYLSDEAVTPDSLAKFAIPATTVSAGGYAVITGFDDDANANSFGLSANGDQVFLTVGDANGPTHFADNVSFGAIAEGESYGRVANWFVPLSDVTLRSANSDPRVGPVVISEIQYNPGSATNEAVALYPELDTNDLEYFEIHNPTGAAVALANWRVRGGADYNFDDMTLAAGGTVVVTSFNPDRPENASRLAAFRTHYGIGEEVTLVGGFANSLNNAGDRLTLQRPGPTDDDGNFPRYLEDEVSYSPTGLWPANADGLGESLTRSRLSSLGHDPASWVSAAPSPGAVEGAGNPDIDGNGVADETDIQLVCSGINGADNGFDFDGNGILDQNDFAFYIERMFGTSIGDSNLDGQFSSSDLVTVFTAGEYEDGTAGNSTWSEGDWNCDGDFTTTDLVFAFDRGIYVDAAVASTSLIAGAIDHSQAADNPVDDANDIATQEEVALGQRQDLDFANVDKVFGEEEFAVKQNKNGDSAEDLFDFLAEAE